MLAELRTALNNPFTIKNFYTLFMVTTGLLLLGIASITVYTRSVSFCQPFQLRFNGNLDSGKGKVYQFTYNGPSSCKLVITPKMKPQEDMSLWIYKPDKSIEVVDLPAVNTKEAVIKTDGNQGTYKLSLRNNDNSKNEYELKILVSER